MFSNPDFQIDETSEQFQLINPALKKLEAKRNKSKFKLRENEILKDNKTVLPFIFLCAKLLMDLISKVKLLYFILLIFLSV